VVGVPTRTVRTKDGNFCFTPQEWQEMKGMTTDERLRKLKAEFSDDVAREAIVYLSNKITAIFYLETR
jgi:hypothetical protein